MNNENIRLVGDLQDYGVPYSSLYVDVELRRLYIFVRVSSPDHTPTECVATEVTPQNVREYLAGNVGIVSFFDGKDYGFVKMENGQISQIPPVEEIPDARMKKLNYFDPEFCYDDIWLEVFLNRFVENKHLEIS